MLRNSRIAVLQRLSNIVTPLIFLKNHISYAFFSDCTLLVHNLRFMTIGKDAKNIDTKSFAFLDSSRFKTTERCKARVTALALPNQTSNSLSCFPSLVNAAPKDT